jgi:aarF domain-containing kinase
MEFQMTSLFDADDQKESTEEKYLQQQDLSESFWTNGHLLEGTAGSRGSYVTRWKKGVKVAEPLVKYDPISAEKLLFRQPAKWLIRNVQIAVPLGLWVGGVLWDIATQQEEKNRRNRAKQLLNTLTTLGPAIIKGGQALASRPDLMPSEYLEELQKLQDDVPTFSNKLAFATVEEELSLESFSDVFELIEPEPVAAASLGQVYRAKLLSNGDIVALKIQRPDCEQIIALDLYVLRWWSGVATAIMSLLQRDINVQMIIDDFGEIIYRELDYVAELANAQRFAELYAAVNDVFVPKVYSELTTSKVLTMEWVDGYRLSDPNLEAYGLDRKKLVDILIQCSLRQILENGFFHGKHLFFYNML